MPAESDSAENEDIEDKEAEANELFEFKAKFREDVEVFLETAEENWNKESFRKVNENEIKVGTQHRSRRANKHRWSGVSL